MNSNGTTKALREILSNIRTPERLNSHPWVKRPFVQETITHAPDWAKKHPGLQLVLAIGQIFPRMMPSVPPKQGLRLDTRWGEFGLLASQYFAPLQFGIPYPTSFRDAWGRIDDAILHYVAQVSGRPLTESERLQFQLVCHEPEVAANSTLSDWHRKGIERLATVISDYEAHLGNGAVKASTELSQSSETNQSPANHAEERNAQVRKKRGWLSGRTVLTLLALCLFTGIVLGGFKLRRIYLAASRVQKDVQQLQVVRASLDGLDDLQRVGAPLSSLRRDLAALRAETEPWLWVTPPLGGIPSYGGDLTSASDLLGLAENLTIATDELYQTSQPVIESLGSSQSLDPVRLTELLRERQPELAHAQEALDRAIAHRTALNLERLSPEVRTLIVDKVDPLLSLMQDGLTLGTTIPKLMGGTAEGPKTYLLLIQNEDELRPTGGFISAIGTLVLKDGNVVSLTFEDSYALDDWSKAYPVAPLQLQRYMNIPVLTLRDSNWFSDYRTAVEYAEYLYSLGRSHSADGVIAIDQHMLLLVLEAIGPVDVEGAPYPVSSENVIEYMRSAKIPPPQETRPEDWQRKAFINKIAAAILQKLLVEGGIEWKSVSRALVRGLDEKHLLLQFDDAGMTALLRKYNWDGAINAEPGDFLMLVDANVGYTKSNAVLETSLFYDVDLTDMAHPVGSVTVIEKNRASKGIACDAAKATDAQDMYYPINRCYWGYLRVYKPGGTQLLDGRAHAIHGADMLLGEALPAQVDSLYEEMEGISTFGALVLVPAGESVDTAFRFALPVNFIAGEEQSDSLVYRLKLQKQPGTLAIPLTLRIHLPSGAAVASSPQGSVIEGSNVLIHTDLRVDQTIEIVFRLD